MKKNLAITINQDLVLQVFGDYIKDAGDDFDNSEQFLISEINLYKGNLTEYTDFLDGISNKHNIWEYLENLCLDNIKNNQ